MTRTATPLLILDRQVRLKGVVARDVASHAPDRPATDVEPCLTDWAAATEWLDPSSPEGAHYLKKALGGLGESLKPKHEAAGPQRSLQRLLQAREEILALNEQFVRAFSLPPGAPAVGAVFPNYPSSRSAVEDGFPPVLDDAAYVASFRRFCDATKIGLRQIHADELQCLPGLEHIERGALDRVHDEVVQMALQFSLFWLPRLSRQAKVTALEDCVSDVLELSETANALVALPRRLAEMTTLARTELLGDCRHDVELAFGALDPHWSPKRLEPVARLIKGQNAPELARVAAQLLAVFFKPDTPATQSLVGRSGKAPRIFAEESALMNMVRRQPSFGPESVPLVMRALKAWPRRGLLGRVLAHLPLVRGSERRNPTWSIKPEYRELGLFLFQQIEALQPMLPKTLDEKFARAVRALDIECALPHHDSPLRAPLEIYGSSNQTSAEAPPVSRRPGPEEGGGPSAGRRGDARGRRRRN